MVDAWDDVLLISAADSAELHLQTYSIMQPLWAWLLPHADPTKCALGLILSLQGAWLRPYFRFAVTYEDWWRDPWRSVAADAGLVISLYCAFSADAMVAFAERGML